MQKRRRDKALTQANGEVRELTQSDMARFKPAREALPAALAKSLGVRGPQKKPTKERITIRLSRDVLDPFKQSGEGWQSRIDEALRAWLKRHSPQP